MTTTMPASTANWHWKNKNVTPWARSWFERELTSITIKGDGEEVVSISQVTDVDGDVELGQRKSKLITIYDCKIDLKWTGTTTDGEEVAGLLKIPEVSHEITLNGLSDYVFEWSLTTATSPAVDKVYQLAKSRLPTALEAKLAEFPSALIDTHGKDLQVSADPSRSGTPAPAQAQPIASSSAAKTNGPKPVKREEKPLNTSNVSVDATFMAAADDLFSLLTDQSRIPMWTRAPAESKAEAGGAFSLFGGGVKGTFVSLEPPKKFVQNWALSSPTWPSGHYGVMTTTLEQSSDSTKVNFSLDGVPKGMEDEIKRNMEGYYVQGLKAIGYVQLIVAPSPPSSASSRSIPSRLASVKKSVEEVTPWYARSAALFLAALALAAAFAVPLLYK